jgi:cytidylate kinase
MKHISIAIDGPSGAGKSTLAREAAKELNYLYVDTGAIYRTIGYYVLQNGIDPQDEHAVLSALPKIDFALRYGDDGLQHMLLNGTDVTAEIRLPEVSMCASAVSAYPGVRAFLLDMQRKLAEENDVLMDGRDIGTVVLPDADVKIFLTASSNARAQRRKLELEQRGTPEDFAQILAEIKKRDYDDTHRAASPLRKAEDALLLDTTELNFQESLRALLQMVQKRIKQ